MKLIVGLGNPGKRYAKTRHNVGFMILDRLHDIIETTNDWTLSNRFNAMVSDGSIHGQKILLAKPMTFMNASGEAVQLIVHYHKLSPSDVIIVHDDKDLPLGAIKVHTNRGHAGHNGVRSIMEYLGSQDCTRVRVGIAPDTSKKMDDVAEFVLRKFSLLERNKTEQTIKQAVAEIEKMF